MTRCDFKITIKMCNPQIKSPLGDCVLDLESDFKLWAFSSLRLESDSVGPGASSVRAGGWSMGGGVAEEVSGAVPLSNTTSSTGGAAGSDEGIYQNIASRYCVSLSEDILSTIHHLL